jgi:hypothetical protein
MIRSTIFVINSSRDDKNFETHRISRYANDPTIWEMPSAMRSFFGQGAALAEEHLGWDLQEFGRLHSVCPVVQSNFRRISAGQENTHDQPRASLN